MSESSITFGVCPRCGRRGTLEPSSVLPYQVPSDTGEVGHGFELESFRGQNLCKWCIETIEDDEESAKQVELDRRDQELRAKLGYRKSYS